MKRYRGFVLEPTVCRVTVVTPDRAYPLDPRYDIRNHSPTGFAWGYGGSGPSQLAIALLCDAVGPTRALPLYQRFKVERIARLPQDSDWMMTSADIVAWVEEAEPKA